MAWNVYDSVARDGDLIQLVGLRHKNYIFRLKTGGDLHTHRGVLKHDDIIGLSWGSQLFSHLGNPFFLLQPSLADILRDIKRTTQILYPKDIGFIIVFMGIGEGQHILEAGTGSGAFTSALAYYVGEKGHVTSYENREQMHLLARKNLAKLGLIDRVTLKLRDIESGFDEKGVDVCFLDLPNPDDYISQVSSALKDGGYFGCILPTVNQSIRLLDILRKNNFAFIEQCEIFLRYYRPEPKRLRPVDRMVAHTGYLVFARKVSKANYIEDNNNENEEDIGFDEM